MGKILIAIMCLIGFFVSYSYAGNLKDGLSAYDKGDYETAYKLLLIDAKNGNANAQSRLGIMYRNGQGVRQDYKQYSFRASRAVIPSISWMTLPAHRVIVCSVPMGK